MRMFNIIRHSANRAHQSSGHPPISNFMLPFQNLYSPIFQERRICVRKNLDICNLSGQLGINRERLDEWLRQTVISSKKMETETLPERSSSPYRLAAPTSLSLAPSSGQPKLFRGRRPASGNSVLPRALRHARRISKNC